jgi:hypothetical protein
MVKYFRYGAGNAYPLAIISRGDHRARSVID